MGREPPSNLRKPWTHPCALGRGSKIRSTPMTEEMKTTEDRKHDIEEMRRTRRLYLVSFNIAFPGWLLSRIIDEILPEDVRIVGCDRDIMTGCNHLCIHSDSFPEGEISKQIPQLSVNVTVGPDKEIERVFLTEYNYETKQTEERSWRKE